MCRNRLHTLGISSSGCDVKEINGSLNSRGWLYGFLSMLCQPLVLALFGVNPPRRSFCQGRRQLHVLNVNVHGLDTLTLRISEHFDFLRFSMNDAFPGTLPFRRGNTREELSAVGLAQFICFHAPYDENENGNSSVHYNPRLESPWLRSRRPDPLRAKSIAIRRVRSRPRNAPFSIATRCP